MPIVHYWGRKHLHCNRGTCLPCTYMVKSVPFVTDRLGVFDNMMEMVLTDRSKHRVKSPMATPPVSRSWFTHLWLLPFSLPLLSSKMYTDGHSILQGHLSFPNPLDNGPKLDNSVQDNKLDTTQLLQSREFKAKRLLAHNKTQTDQPKVKGVLYL